MNKLILGTNNKHKIKEITEIFQQIYPNIEINTIDPNDDAPEKELSFNQNAYLKAKYYYNKYKLPILTDDSGICVEALNNRPGVLSKRYSNTGLDLDNNLKMLEEMKDKENRKAFYNCSICLYINDELFYLFEGQLHGKINYELKGTNGFGYDSLFYLDEYQKNVAEIDEKIKNELSHRRNALNKMKEYLLKE